MTNPSPLESIYFAALEKQSSTERMAFLNEACAGNDELRGSVERMLVAQAEAGSFLEQPAVAGAATVHHEHPITEQPGTVIGPYKLLQQIGEGGMGVVFMAEQTHPVQRTVALKIIKPGMDTRQVIARFEAERQAVAMMDHPNIAKVLDAGTTDSGRPYFVMELVKGVPITKYCDEKQLPLCARLELFTQVCQAVQHAHQKGIIHRDIKPNNVLVAEYDNRSVPKVIDFGVAKATAHRLTERTMFTEFGQVLGTMEYMSPEQSKFNQLDIDTRSDIYSLGVLLYELLAGSTPFEGKRLHAAAFDEMLRIIREEEPQKPSTRLSSIDTLPSVAANRHTEPARLSKDVRGELDWIVMKALEKDRNRRYETASGFAADIERHLHDEPVEAGPPSVAYRFRKFAKRNRTTLAAGALLAISLLVALGGVASGIGWAVRDRAAREEQFALERMARQAKVSGQLELILADVARLEQGERWSDALVSARRAELALAAGEAPPDVQERVRQTLADLDLVHRLDEIRAQSGTFWASDAALRLAANAQADQEYTAAFRQAGIDFDALPVSEAVDRIAARRPIAAALLPALDDWVAVRSVGKDEAATRRLIDVLHRADPDPWRQQVRDAVARKDWPTLQNLTTSADLDRQPAATLGFLYAAIHLNQTQFPGWAARERDLVLRRAQWKYSADYWINHRLGVDLIWRQTPNDIRDGIGFMRVAVALRPQSAHSVMNLGNGYLFLRQHDDAIACFRKAIELNPNSFASYGTLGIALGQKGVYEEAIAALDKSIELSPNRATEAYAELSMILSNCPDAHLRNPRRAAELAEKAIEIDPQFINPWIALGVARYRGGQWWEARTAFDKSLQFETGFSSGTFRWAEALDWFFLAMCHQQMGQKEESRKCYENGVAWMEKNPGISEPRHTEQLIRIRAEAEELLKITDKKPTTKPPVEVK